MSQNPLLAPIYPIDQHPEFLKLNEIDRENLLQVLKYQKWTQYGMESCAFKTVLSAGAGFGLGAFFSLVSSSFAFDDPLSRQSELSRQQKAKQLFSDMGKSMYRQGKGFGAVGGLFAGIECCIEGYRAKNDMYNSASAGFISGSILSRSAGVKAAFGGGFAFAAFSTAIDWYMRSPPSDNDY